MTRSRTFALDASIVTLPSGSGYNAFPGIARMRDGRLIVAYRHATTHVSADGDLMLTFSSDEGATWTDPVAVRTSVVEEWDVRGASVTVTSSGYVWLVWFQSDGTLYPAVRLMRSINNAATWSDPVTVTSTFVKVASGPAKVTELADGTLLLPIYGNDDGGDEYTARVVRSTDGGATWAGEVDLATGANYSEAEIAVLPDGSQLALIRREDGNTCRSTSTVWGTWSAPATVFNGLGRPSITVLPGGELVCSVRNTGSNSGSLARISYGSISSWPVAFTLSTGTSEYGATCILANGDIGAVYSTENSATDADLFFRAIRSRAAVSRGAVSRSPVSRVAV